METPLDYRLLAQFIAVASERSFSKAARRLGVGKGTVSRGIASLERRLGTELLHRTTHSVALSTAGLALYERVAPQLASIDQAISDLPERAEQPSGELRLTAPSDFAAVVLPSLIAQFLARYPEVSIDLRVSNEHLDLVSNGIDLAIRVAGPERLKDSSLIARKLAATTIRCFASPAYLARRGVPASFGDPEHDWVIFPPLMAATSKLKGVRPRVMTGDFVVLCNLLREGLGVGALPAFVAAEAVRAGALVPVLPDELLRGGGGFFMVYPSRGQLARKVAVFRDFLLERLELRE